MQPARRADSKFAFFMCLGMAACRAGVPDDGASADPKLSASPRDADVDLDQALASLNAQIDQEHLALKKLSKEEFLEWVSDWAPLVLIPKARTILDDGFRRGVLA